MNSKELAALAIAAMDHAYAPYSGCRVGAALLCADGTVYLGANLENAAYSPTVCAERVAFFKAVFDGHRSFTALAVCGGKDGVRTGFFPPCGVCRQVMGEFCGDDFKIILVGAGDDLQELTLADLLPHRFSGREHLA
jgi:cytidine deaminase